jgi:hypothetical protein
MVSQTYAARFAVLVGNSYGGKDVAALKYVKNDLDQLRLILQDFCGFNRENVITLHDKKQNDLIQVFQSIAGKLPSTEDNLLLFYYTGHADQQNLKMGNDRFALQNLKELFSRFPATIRIGIFDACQSGMFTRLKGGTLSEPFMFKDDGKIKGQVILTSSSPNENSQESDLIGNSVFTFHFVNALRGSGDLSGDRKVTLAEAYQYSYNHTVASTAKSWGGTQHPSYLFQIQGEGDIVLADLNVRSVGILLQNWLGGDITIQDSNGNIVADLTKNRNSTMMIALNSGMYEIVRNDGNRKWKALVSVGENAITQLTEEMFAEVEVQKSRRKGTEKDRTTFGIGIGGGYDHRNNKAIDKSVSDQFAVFSRYGMMPVFRYKDDPVKIKITAEIALKGKFIALLNYNGNTAEDHHELNGTILNEIDNKWYSTHLKVQRELHISIIDQLIGYRFRYGSANGFSLFSGFSVMTISHSVSSVYADSLFNYENSNEYVDKGFLLVPSFGIGYFYQFLPFMRLSVDGIYRYHRESESLHSYPAIFTKNGSNSKKSGQKLMYSAAGFGVSLSLLFFIKLGGSEE